jgi:hypothetical protein
MLRQTKRKPSQASKSSARGGRISFYLTDSSTFAGGSISLRDNVPVLIASALHVRHHSCKRGIKTRL